MVGADGGDAPVGECLAEGIAVGGRLDAGVALDERPQPLVVAVGEQQMGHDGLGRDVAELAEQLQFAGCGDMGHMQAGAEGLCQADGEERRGVAGLLAADELVQGDREVGLCSGGAAAYRTGGGAFGCGGAVAPCCGC